MGRRPEVPAVATARNLCGALLLALAWGSAGADSVSVSPVPLHPIAPGVFLRPGVHEAWGPSNRAPVANSGVIIGERCVAVIDPGGNAAEGRALKAALRRITSLPVCHVINTHGHPDHVLGNVAFKEGVSEKDGPAFIGHHRLPAALAARGPYYLRSLRRPPNLTDDGTRIVPPTRLVRDTLELDLGGRRILLRAWPTAHTDADLTVWDGTTETLWLGDLLFDGHMPVVDGSLLGWLDVLDRLRGQTVRRAVPGHGAPSADWPAVLSSQTRYLTGLRDDTRAAIRAQWSIDTAAERIRPAAGTAWKLSEEFHRRNVTAAYAELEWED